MKKKTDTVGMYTVPLALTLTKPAYEALRRAAAAASLRLSKQTGLRIDAKPSTIIEGLIHKELSEYFAEAQ